MESTYTMWERRLEVPVARATYEIHAAGASLEVAGALHRPLGSPVLVLERISHGKDDKALEVAEFYNRPERYRFSLTLPRNRAGPRRRDRRAACDRLTSAADGTRPQSLSQFSTHSSVTHGSSPSIRKATGRNMFS